MVGGVPVVGGATCGGWGYLVMGGAILLYALRIRFGKSHACLYCEWSPPIYSNKN